MSRKVERTDSAASLIAALEAMPRMLETDVEATKLTIDSKKDRLKGLEASQGKPFQHAERLKAAEERLKVVEAELEKLTGPNQGAEAAPAGGELDPFTMTPQERAVFDMASELEDEEQQAQVLADLRTQMMRRVAADRRNEGGFLDPAMLGLGKDKEPEEPFVQMTREEIEERYQKAKLKPDAGSLLPKVKDALKELAMERHHFPHLDPTESPLMAQLNEVLLQLEGAGAWGEATAGTMVSEVLAGMDKRGADLLARVLLLRDMVRDVESGTYGEMDEEGVTPIGLPFGFESFGELQENLLLAEKEMENHPGIEAAVKRRQRIVAPVTRQAVKLGILRKEVLNDDRYFHRQVIEYLEARDKQLGLSSRTARAKRRGFQHERVGGSDFNPIYHESEFEWLAQIHANIATIQAQREIRRLADMSKELGAEAKALNAANVEAALIQQFGHTPVGKEHPLWHSRMLIARGSSELKDGLLDGSIEAPAGFQHVVDELAVTDADEDFSHPDWWRMLKALSTEGGDGAMQANMIFKGIAEREQVTKEILGRDYKTAIDLAPEGYVEWQPVKGNVMYRASSVADRVIEAILAGERKLTQEDVTMITALGGPRETWIVPEGLALTLDKMTNTTSDSRVEKLWTTIISAVKQTWLVSPGKIVKYNLRNWISDLEASLMEPAIVKYVPDSYRDLLAFEQGKATPALRDEVLDAIKRRVLGQGLTAAEIEDISKLPQFEKFVTADSLTFMGAILKYYRFARQITQFRENILRLAAYRHFEKMRKDNPAKFLASYGASRFDIVKALEGKDRSARLARDLLGDYGNISAGGTWARRHLFPFFSWTEVNGKRYTNAFRNIAHEGEGYDSEAAQKSRWAKLAARLGIALGARVTGRAIGLAMLVNIYYALTSIWNHLFFRDELKELGSRAHGIALILGRNKDGSIRWYGIDSAFADYLEWVGLNDWPKDIKDVAEKPARLAQKFQDAALAPINKLAQLLEPVTKTIYELATRRSLFPDVRRPSVIRDRGEYLAQQAAMGWLYRRIMDKPLKPGDTAQAFLGVSNTDPGEAAYWMIREKQSEWRKQNDKTTGAYLPDAKANALYYWRKSVAWGQPARAERWLAKYLELGGTIKGARESVKAGRPLEDMNQHDEAAFRRTLSPEEKEVLNLARKWYRETMSAAPKTIPGAIRRRNLTR